MGTPRIVILDDRPQLISKGLTVAETFSDLRDYFPEVYIAICTRGCRNSRIDSLFEIGSDTKAASGAIGWVPA